MKRNPIIKHLFIAVATLLLFCGVSSIAFADADSPSFTYVFPVDGTSFRLYEIGEIVNDEYVLTGEFAEYSINLTENTAGETLATYVERDGLQPVMTGESVNGSVVFENLECKIYLMTGDVAKEGQKRWIPSAVLFSVPQRDAKTDELVWDVLADGKFDNEYPEKDQLAVEKIWKDTGYEKQRPVSIKVQLLKDGTVYDTVELSKTNNWKYTWENLDPDSVWKVIEEKVPSHYTMTIKPEKGVWVIENTYTSTTPTPTPPPDIPYTGQVWWPVIILLVIGTGLICLGLNNRRK